MTGNAAAKGRGPSEAVRVRQLLREAVSDEDIRLIVEALVSEAKRGNLPAI